MRTRGARADQPTGGVRMASPPIMGSCPNPVGSSRLHSSQSSPSRCCRDVRARDPTGVTTASPSASAPSRSASPTVPPATAGPRESSAPTLGDAGRPRSAGYRASPRQRPAYPRLGRIPRPPQRGRSTVEGLNGALTRAAEAQDADAVRTASVDILDFVDVERDWLRDHPPTDCYADAHGAAAAMLDAYGTAQNGSSTGRHRVAGWPVCRHSASRSKRPRMPARHSRRS